MSPKRVGRIEGTRPKEKAWPAGARRPVRAARSTKRPPKWAKSEKVGASEEA